MRIPPSEERPRPQVRVCAPAEPDVDPDPVHEYQSLVRELQEGVPDTAPHHLDKQVAWIMANYSGYTPAAIKQAMHKASIYLARYGGDAQAYVERTVEEAMQKDVWEGKGLGWGA